MSFKVVKKGPSLQAIIKTLGKMEDEYLQWYENGILEKKIAQKEQERQNGFLLFC